MVTPPAGAVGRGDGFILRIAEKSGALVLSNDSFQEFHAERPWLFEPGRLIGGKPVPGVGWVFTPRTPVRGPRSRSVTAQSKREAKAAAGGGRRHRRRTQRGADEAGDRGAGPVPPPAFDQGGTLPVASRGSTAGQLGHGGRRRRLRGGGRPEGGQGGQGHEEGHQDDHGAKATKAAKADRPRRPHGQEGGQGHEGDEGGRRRPVGQGDDRRRGRQVRQGAKSAKAARPPRGQAKAAKATKDRGTSAAGTPREPAAGTECGAGAAGVAPATARPSTTR